MKGGDVTYKDLINQKFGKLTVVKYVYTDRHNRAIWLCKCDCGSMVEVSSNSLQRSNTKSCGCLKGINQRGYKYNYPRLYNIWQQMKARCYNKNNPDYKNYGARGITICGEWLSNFQAFYEWSIDNGYKKNLTIDRIDVNGNYEPNNCHWATTKQQNRNTRNNKYITINGEMHCLKEWCEILNLNYETVKSRLRYGWNIEKALELKGRRI